MDKNAKIGIDDFMLKDSKDIKRNRMQQLVSQMGAAASRAPTVKHPQRRAKKQ